MNGKLFIIILCKGVDITHLKSYEYKPHFQIFKIRKEDSTMDHKEFLDNILKEMSEKETARQNITEDDNIDGMIKLKISTGEIYLIDPNTFDWDASIGEMQQLESNADQIRQMMFAALNNPPEEEIDNMTIQLMKYLEGYQINPDYERFDPEITKEKKLMMLLFDTAGIIAEMSRNISLYSAISMFTKSPSSFNSTNKTPLSNNDITAFLGETTTELYDRCDINPIKINGSDVFVETGSVALYGHIYYIYDGNIWYMYDYYDYIETDEDTEDSGEDKKDEDKKDEETDELERYVPETIVLDDDHTTSGLIEE